MESPEVDTPEVNTQELETRETATRETGTPEIGTPEIGTPEIETQRTGSKGDLTAGIRIISTEPDRLACLQSNPHARPAMRIAIFGSRGIPHTYGGAEAFVEELAPRLAKRGHRVTVYCRRSLFRERPPLYRGVDLIYLPNIETKALGTPTHTLACMLDVVFRPVDVFLVLNIVNGFHCVLPRLLGRTFAINVDGVDWKRGKWGWAARKYFHLNARWIGNICPQGVITDAAEMQRIYQDEFGTASTCIAYGANIERSENSEVVRQYGLEPSEYYLIASRMVSENNPDLIVEAFEGLKTNRMLAVAGGVNYRSEFVRKLQRTRDPRIKFLGHVADARHVKELHCNAYAYVHGHSLGGTNPSLVKALGYGNCVLALNTPFNREVLDGYGIMFERDVDDLRRQMQTVEDDPAMAEEFREHAPERIRQAYAWDHITDQYEDFFYQLVESHRSTKIKSAVL